MNRPDLERELREMYLDPEFLDWLEERRAEAMQVIDADQELKWKTNQMEIEEPPF